MQRIFDTTDLEEAALAAATARSNRQAATGPSGEQLPDAKAETVDEFWTRAIRHRVDAWVKDFQRERRAASPTILEAIEDPRTSASDRLVLERLLNRTSSTRTITR